MLLLTSGHFSLISYINEMFLPTEVLLTGCFFVVVVILAPILPAGSTILQEPGLFHWHCYT